MVFRDPLEGFAGDDSKFMGIRPSRTDTVPEISSTEGVMVSSFPDLGGPHGFPLNLISSVKPNDM